MAKKIAVIVGGLSSEREVSFNTGKSFAKALDELGWAYEIIEAKEDLPKVLFEKKPDVALLALHGKLAEDGTVQGICEYLKIPYTGSGVLSSALAMNKVMAKQVFVQNGLPTPDWQVFKRGVDLAPYKTTLEYPLVVKPARDGSSVGLSICYSKDQLDEAVELAFQYDRVILLEEYISGMEVTVATLLDRALTSIEIAPKNGFYDYENKYTAGKTDYIIPARLGAETQGLLGELALKTCRVLDIRTYSRVDFRVREDGEPFILEVNTLPGATETSLVPKAAAHDGISFSQLIKQLVDSAGLDYEGVS